MIAGTLLVVLTGIFLPGILIEGQERKAVGEVQAVPAQYIASDSLLAKEASESLKLNDRIQLITGQWESETQEALSLIHIWNLSMMVRRYSLPSH